MCNENQIVLGVVTDSHVPERMKSIPESAIQCFYQNDVTTILHAGDICNSRALTQLEKVAPVIAVRGNRDIWSSTGRSLPLSLVVEFGGVKIGLTHGHGGLWQYFYEKVLYYTVGFSYSRYFHRLHNEFANSVSGNIVRTFRMSSILLISPISHMDSDSTEKCNSWPCSKTRSKIVLR